jgi:dUTP pyrophosphatase
MKVKIKKLHPDAVIPKYAKSGDAAMDLTATSKEVDHRSYVGGLDIITYGTGLAMEIPEGYVGLIYPRSSIYKTDLILSNHVGVVDSGYRGEIMFKFRKTNYKEYEIGERIGQIIIIPYPQVNFQEVDELDDTERGDGGFGSSGS